ncbi:hypothetical protein BW37_04867 [Janthinobacterium lividum]|nr:hypothetical protein BW37_04867 [Janthinobacterium lividum]
MMASLLCGSLSSAGAVGLPAASLLAASALSRLSMPEALVKNAGNGAALASSTLLPGAVAPKCPA